MNLHEYQGKQLFAEYGLPVSKGIAAETVAEAVAAADEIGGDKWVVKAQVHAGGRGKGGGVKVVKSVEEVREKASEILGMTLVTHQTGPEGRLVKRLYVEAGSDIKKEYYLSAVVDRVTKTIVFMASTEGGMEIEEVAEKTPEKIITVSVDAAAGIQGFHARKLGFGLGLSGNTLKQFIKLIFAIYKAFEETDASQLEINPLVETNSGDIIALDAKYNFDDNALYRQPKLAELRDLAEEDPLEVEAGESGLNYVKLDGNVGCMVNGAGLAMATMDMIKLSGGEPANFLDVGGGANATTVEAGFRIILKDPNVKAILINVFGGIVRCDRIANGVVEAYKSIGDIRVPIIVRLQGTNAAEGAKIIDDSGLKVFSAITLKEAAERVKAAL